MLTATKLRAEGGATANSYKDSTDPTYTGPGAWNSIHRRALRARTLREQEAFERDMKEECRTFPCSACSNHCTQYIKSHPLKEYFGVRMEVDGKLLELGMFIWTWRFHNAVNARLNKPLMSWDTAYSLYAEPHSSSCSTVCTAAAEDHEPVVKSHTKLTHPVERVWTGKR